MKNTVHKLFSRLKNKKTLLLIVVVLLVIIGILFLRNSKKTQLTSTEVQQGTLKQELVLSGEIDAREKANLAFPISGKVVYLSSEKGEMITKNQLIASLDQASVVKSAQSALLDYNIQRNTFDQAKDDANVSSISDATSDDIKRILQNNQYNLDKAVVSLELKELAKRDSNLYSPIEGYLTDVKDVHVGSNVAAGTPLFEIVNPNTFYFSVVADQTEVVGLSEGESCQITLDAFENKILTGNIARISYTPKAGESGTVYEVEVNIDPSQLTPDLRLGMTGDATFVTSEKANALYVPSKYVKTDDKGTYVLVSKNKDKKYVKTGIEIDENTEIISGVSEGDIVYD